MAEVLRSALLAGVPHGFSGREGLDAKDILPGSATVWLRQVHSAKVLIVRDPWDEPPEGDAMVTRRPGLLLGIVTADCAPVLLSDPKAGVVGAAHAGWRGALRGVIENTVAAMRELGASTASIRAVIGPTIAQANYEVDEAFRAEFDEDESRFFASGRPGHRQFDLPGYVGNRLRAAGVERIDDLAEDTYAQPGRFFSYRRATHRKEATGGRQISMIGCRG